MVSVLPSSRLRLRLLFLWGAWAVAWHPAATAAPTSVSMAANGVNLKIVNGTIRIPSTTPAFILRVGDAAPLPNPHTGRVRYRLEGVDADWRERTDVMLFSLYFYDRAGNRVGQQSYPVKGRSPGWNETPEASTFTPRREIFTVPPRADRLEVSISSAGPAATVGVYAVQNVRIVRPAADEAASQTVLDSGPFSQQGNKPEKGASQWIPDGTQPAMATMADLRQPGSLGRAFLVRDDDGSAHAEWHSIWEKSSPVVPGERLTVEWNEMYETGVADVSFITYGPLPPGHYRFRVQELDVLDHPLPSTSSLEIMVVLPYWKTPWFWSGCAGVAAVLLYRAGKYVLRAKMRRHLQEVRLVEQERLRIAQDLHDDLGTRLAHISLISSFAESTAPSPEARSNFQEISGMTRELVASLSEVVWTVNPANDNLESLVNFLCQLTHKLCSPSPLRFQVDALPVTSGLPVPSDVRHHVILAVKEAVTNSLRHSAAQELRVVIRFSPPLLSISIADDGTGFAPESTPPGNGLTNMRQRMAAVRGRMTLESAPGKGTQVAFEIPIA